MRSWLLFILVIIGTAAGIAVGYAVATVEAVANAPLLNPRPSSKVGFDRAVEDFAKLGGYESVAANCGGTSDTQAATHMEAEVIRDLRERTAIDANLLSVAEARLLVRTMIKAEKNTPMSSQTHAVQRVEDLLRNAGWAVTSEDHMREIIRELDGDQCRQIALGRER
jgi:hypothetical protein